MTARRPSRFHRPTSTPPTWSTCRRANCFTASMIPSSPATRSNPCQGGATKFAPIHDALGACVPTLYAAETVQAAIYETILHDVPLGAAFKSVPHDAVESRQHSTLVVRRTLHLASLRAPDLMKWGLTPATLIGSMPTQYPYTARWAKALHDQFAQVDGLVWTSNLCDPDIRTRPCSSSGTVST